jgi:hypothetical protein
MVPGLKNSWMVDECFCRGFREKWRAERGFLMVNSCGLMVKHGEKSALEWTLKIFHFFKYIFAA